MCEYSCLHAMTDNAVQSHTLIYTHYTVVHAIGYLCKVLIYVLSIHYNRFRICDVTILPEQHAVQHSCPDQLLIIYMYIK